ncbi:MAG: RHS repeat-associated core domain-containing protein, partial [Porticoccaceae bacterium]|nr:RHS repeat-associated core domain-containing protein [Porticoccaceae bacterium]
SKGGTTFQNLDYAWRSNGTLQSRMANPNTGVSTTRKESFSYDAHNRLTQATTVINGSHSRDLNYQYNHLGNILSKTSTRAGDVDVTGYGYHGSKKHAVTSATISDSSGSAAHTLTYDANGAITKYDKAGTSTEDKHIQYNAANQPIKIVVGSSINDSNAKAVDEFRYGPDGQRYARKTTWKEGGTTKEEHVSYIGAVEYTTYVNNPSLYAKYKTRVGSNIMRVSTLVYYPNVFPGQGPNYQVIDTTEYAHRDHLGSIETVTDQAGNRLHQLAFEPFGARKDSDWTRNITTAALDALLREDTPPPHKIARGFTGHEHLDKTGFIHMNGRVYDPALGRFLSPDPIVQAPTNSQSWNRYAYTFNNPLNATDSSGYVSIRLFGFEIFNSNSNRDAPVDFDGSGKLPHTSEPPRGFGAFSDHRDCKDRKIIPGIYSGDCGQLLFPLSRLKRAYDGFFVHFDMDGADAQADEGTGSDAQE